MDILPRDLTEYNSNDLFVLYQPMTLFLAQTRRGCEKLALRAFQLLNDF